jgi:hypothetical protein
LLTSFSAFQHLQFVKHGSTHQLKYVIIIMDDCVKNGRFKAHAPEHPLPEEIRLMTRDDTVCKFCGVSYLIHNEIKRLEDQLEEAMAELLHLRGCEKREEARQLQLKEEAAVRTKLESTVMTKDAM